MPEGDDRVAERAERPGHGRRIVGAAVVAALVLAGLAAGAGAQTPPSPPPAPRAVQPPPDNVFPIPTPYEVTYSDSWHACRDGCARQHKGNDLMADEGVPVVAVESGVIVRANGTDEGLGGITLWLKGDSGVAYYYAHNVQNLVAEGQRVARGEMIARVGRTGNARTTAPHVHFQINLCGETSSAEPCTVDPHPYLQTWAQAQVGGGVDGVGWYEPATGAFGQRNESGSPLTAFPFGTPGADQVPVAGDWDGDGRDSVGLYSRTDAVFTLRDDEGAALPPLPFGQAGRPDVWPIAGDFDGDGRDTVGLYRQGEAAFVVLVDVGVESAPVTLGHARTGRRAAGRRRLERRRPGQRRPLPAGRRCRRPPRRRRRRPARGDAGRHRCRGVPGGRRLGRRRPRGRRAPAPGRRHHRSARAEPARSRRRAVGARRGRAGRGAGGGRLERARPRHARRAAPHLRSHGRRPQGRRGAARPQRRHAASGDQHAGPQGRVPGHAAQRERLPLRRGRGGQRQHATGGGASSSSRARRTTGPPATSSASTWRATPTWPSTAWPARPSPPGTGRWPATSTCRPTRSTWRR